MILTLKEFRVWWDRPWVDHSVSNAKWLTWIESRRTSPLLELGKGVWEKAPEGGNCVVLTEGRKGRMVVQGEELYVQRDKCATAPMPQEGEKAVGFPKALWASLFTAHSHGLQGCETEPGEKTQLPRLLLVSHRHRGILPKCISEDWGAVHSPTHVLIESLRKLLGGRTTFLKIKKFFKFHCGENTTGDLPS